jgi:hypothetical protein
MECACGGMEETRNSCRILMGKRLSKSILKGSDDGV